MKRKILKSLILPALIFAVSACGSSSSSDSTTTATTATTDNTTTSTDSYATPTGSATISKSTSTIGHAVRTATSGSKDCLACHVSGGAAASKVIFTIAGTVYTADGTAPNTSGTVKVEVYPATGHTGTVIEVPVDTKGNFYATKTSVPSASLVSFKLVSSSGGGTTKTMSKEDTGGGCTSCHTGDVTKTGKFKID